MELYEQEPVVVIAEAGGLEEACHEFFYGTYHYCGDAGPGYVRCCPMELH